MVEDSEIYVQTTVSQINLKSISASLAAKIVIEIAHCYTFFFIQITIESRPYQTMHRLVELLKIILRSSPSEGFKFLLDLFLVLWPISGFFIF